MKAAATLIALACAPVALASCTTDDPDSALPDDPSGKADDSSTTAGDFFLSCSGQYTYVSGGATFDEAPIAPEIQATARREMNGGGVDVWRTIDAETADFKYFVKLWVETENEHSNYLEYRIESKNTGSTVSGLAYPEKSSSHGFLVRLVPPKDTVLGQTTDGHGRIVPITRASLFCLISKVRQNSNMETTYPTLQTVPLS